VPAPGASQNGKEPPAAADRQGGSKDVVPTRIPHLTASNNTPQNLRISPNRESTGGTENRVEGTSSGAGVEGLSQEELNEIGDDPEANMDEQE
jgi:hypothetical protein